MSIHGIGNDIIEIERIRQAIDSHGLRMLQRLFSPREQDYCLKHRDPAPHWAGRFAAKEAIVKALGSGFGEHASWLDIEVVNNQDGRPEVCFSAAVNKKFHNPKILISISHCKQYAAAVAVWVEK